MVNTTLSGKDYRLIVQMNLAPKKDQMNIYCFR